MVVRNVLKVAKSFEDEGESSACKPQGSFHGFTLLKSTSALTSFLMILVVCTLMKRLSCDSCWIFMRASICTSIPCHIRAVSISSLPV